MVVSDVGKIGLLGLFVIGSFTLVLFDKATLGEIAPFLTLIVGYLVGNGAAAVRKHAPTQVITAPVKPNEVVTINGPYPVDRENVA